LSEAAKQAAALRESGVVRKSGLLVPSPLVGLGPSQREYIDIVPSASVIPSLARCPLLGETALLGNAAGAIVIDMDCEAESVDRLGVE
jgi:hypothetical protein